MSGFSPAKAIVRTVSGLLLFGGIGGLLAPNVLTEHNIGLASPVANEPGPLVKQATGRDEMLPDAEENLVAQEFSSLALPQGHLNGADAVTQMPEKALAAYAKAAIILEYSDRTCKLAPQVLAAVARVETDHGRAPGASTDEAGNVTPNIIGERLDGDDGRALVYDTDNGIHDRDTKFDRPIGPFQFLPAKWLVYGRDATGDNQANPHNIFDSALAAGTFLCSGKDDLSQRGALREALLRYRSSTDYADLVLRVSGAYASTFEELRNDAIKTSDVQNAVSEATPSQPQRPAPKKTTPQRQPHKQPGSRPTTSAPDQSAPSTPANKSPSVDKPATEHPSPSGSKSVEPHSTATKPAHPKPDPVTPDGGKPDSSQPEESASSNPAKPTPDVELGESSRPVSPQPTDSVRPGPSTSPAPTVSKPVPTQTTQPKPSVTPSASSSPTSPMWDFTPRWPGLWN